MTRTFITASAVVAILGTAAYAAPVDDVVAMLEAEGYSDIEVEVEGANTEIEGDLDGAEREILIVTATGEVLSDKTEADEEDDEAEEEGDDKS